ncbi:MAG: SAM-dependent methyltransferase [Flavobacteriales bacterium]|jgi:SAM-dependent methyltransferase|nr:SAM-dependent methyltransferase [Flavobacteriales bacterium]|tara:strand:+ start:22919 stop:23647 length:729 start_codon:yes stop_codon:yes gene_type:complete
MSWFHNWFDSKYYHILYKDRDDDEASLLIDHIINKFNFNKSTFFLDLGCGNGRHSVHLNKQGYNVDGIDLSKKSIASALKHTNDTLKFNIQDMRSMNYNNKYDVVLNLFTSFGYFDDDNDNLKVFNNVETSLKKNGYFIIDFFNSDKVIKPLPLSEIKIINGIRFKINKTYDKNFVYKHISIADKKNQYIFTEKVRLINKQDFINYANQTNMELIYTFGDYMLSEFNSIISERLILVFKKKN